VTEDRKLGSMCISFITFYTSITRVGLESDGMKVRGENRILFGSKTIPQLVLIRGTVTLATVKQHILHLKGPNWDVNLVEGFEFAAWSDSLPSVPLGV